MIAVNMGKIGKGFFTVKFRGSEQKNVQLNKRTLKYRVLYEL